MNTTFKKTLIATALLSATATVMAAQPTNVSQYNSGKVETNLDLGYLYLDTKGVGKVNTLGSVLNFSVEDKVGANITPTTFSILNEGNFATQTIDIDQADFAKKANFTGVAGNNTLNVNVERDLNGNTVGLGAGADKVLLKIEDFGTTEQEVSVDSINGTNNNNFVAQSFGSNAGLTYSAENGIAADKRFKAKVDIIEGGSDSTTVNVGTANFGKDSVFASISKSSEANLDLDLNVDGLNKVVTKVNLQDTGSNTTAIANVDELNAADDLTVQVSSQVSSSNIDVESISTKFKSRLEQNSLGNSGAYYNIFDGASGKDAKLVFSAGINAATNTFKGTQQGSSDSFDIKSNQTAYGLAEAIGNVVFDAGDNAVVARSAVGNNLSTSLETDKVGKLAYVQVDNDQLATGNFRNESTLASTLGNKGSVAQTVLANNISTEVETVKLGLNGNIYLDNYQKLTGTLRNVASNNLTIGDKGSYAQNTLGNNLTETVKVTDGIGKGYLIGSTYQVFEGNSAFTELKSGGRFSIGEDGTLSVNQILNNVSKTYEVAGVDYVYEANSQSSVADNANLNVNLPTLLGGEDFKANFANIVNNYAYTADITGNPELGTDFYSSQFSVTDAVSIVNIGSFTGDSLGISTIGNNSSINLTYTAPTTP